MFFFFCVYTKIKLSAWMFRPGHPSTVFIDAISTLWQRVFVSGIAVGQALNATP